MDDWVSAGRTLGARTRARGLQVALYILALSCQGGPASGSSPESTASAADLDRNLIVLALDSAVSVDGLHLRWVELNDSRCPLGVQCIWEGQAIATLAVFADNLAPRRLELVLRPGVEPAAVAVAGYRLRLLDVQPYPRQGTAPQRSEYAATVEIRPS